MIDGGKVVTTNFGENKIPSIRDIPALKTVIQEFPVGNGPYGGMSIGEPPVRAGRGGHRQRGGRRRRCADLRSADHGGEGAGGDSAARLESRME